MTDTCRLMVTIRRAWRQIPAPPEEDLRYMAWASGEDVWLAFAKKAPMAVDISTPGFRRSTPLLDLPPRAAAGYLGTYLLSLLRGLKFQEDYGIFYDILTRAHVLACLRSQSFWEGVIRPHLPEECRAALTELASYLVSRHDLLGLSERQLDQILGLSKG